MNVRAKWHHVTHKHNMYMKGEAVIWLCTQRWPWGKVLIMYQPNPFIQPFEISPDQLKKVLDGEPL